MPKNLNLTDKLEEYIIDHSEELTETQKEIIIYNNKLGDQKKMQLSISQVQFLQTLIKTSNIKNILEIGSFTGFSALSMANSLPRDGKLVSLDKDKKFSEMAKNFYKKAKETKIKQIIKPALESLKELKKEKNFFDLIFIDADKENYLNYYDISIDLVHSGGLIIIDNVLWHGDVADIKNSEKLTNIIRKFNKYVKNDMKTKKIILPLGDGLTICRKI